MKKLLRKFKESRIYSIFVKYLLRNFFNLLWEYIINILGKILYFIWILFRLSKERYQFDKKKCLKIVEFDESFKEIALLANNDLDQSYLKNIESKIIQENQKSEYKNFTQIVTDKLSNKSLNKILDVATSDKIINTVSKYLGVFPILSIVQVYYNIPVKEAELEGSKLWHQDGFGYRSLDFFIPLSNIDDTSGPLYIAESHPEYGIFFKFKNRISDTIQWKNGRVNLNEFSKIYKDEQIYKLSGNIGKAALCDSFQCYHRGGACEKKDRLMLRLSYQTPDAIRLKKPIEFIKTYKKINNNFILNFLYKYLLSYRGFLLSDRVKNYFVHTYHFFTFVK